MKKKVKRTKVKRREVIVYCQNKKCPEYEKRFRTFFPLKMDAVVVCSECGREAKVEGK